MEFPNRDDALLISNKHLVNVEASGSLGVVSSDSNCLPTYPNDTLNAVKEKDWCSNVGIMKESEPWISYSLTDKAMRISGYSVRTGCCMPHYRCCCIETGKILDFDCCCEIYGFSLQGSNDKHNWKVLHMVENNRNIHRCKSQTFDISLTEPFKYVRFVLKEPRKHCPMCMQLNQIELYGRTVEQYDTGMLIDDDFDESISIIGKVRRD